MENSYVNAVIGSTSDFCELFNNYEDELKNLGEKVSDIEKEVADYNQSVAERGNGSEMSYDALDEDRKYHDENGQVIAYGDLTEKQKRGLESEALFIADREIEFKDRIAEASYEMDQSAKKFVNNLRDKLTEVRRSNNHLNQINLQYVADIARNQNVIDDCLHDAPRATTVDEKKILRDRQAQALKENRRIELSMRINVALMNATNIIESVFAQAIANMESTIANEFVDVDLSQTEVIENKMDIASDLSKLMASFTSIKNEYQAEKELITSINEKCKAMRKSTEDKDVRKFASDVMKVTKEFSKLIEDIEKYNKEQKVTNDGPENNGPENNGPENDGPENNEPENDGPENNGPENDGPENDGPENNGPENNGPENNGPENNGPENNGPENNGPEEPTRQNQDVEYKVNRKRQADSAKRNLAMAALGVGLVAANGLGLAPLAGAVLSGGILAVAGAGLANGALTAYKRAAATHKLKKIAKEMRKVGLEIHLGEFDYEKGTVEYMVTDKDDKEVSLKDAELVDPRLIDVLKDKLDEEFRNKQRGLGDKCNPLSKFEIDMQEMPPVTINNLEAAYAPIGGIRSFKDDVLGEAFSWDTNSSLIGKIKDSKFVKNLRDRSEKPVADAELEDILEEQEVPGVEEENGQETPNVEEENEQEVAPDAPETQEQDVPETPEQNAPEAPASENPESNGEGNQGAEEEEDLLSELEETPSNNMSLTDEEIEALLSDLGNAENIEQGVEQLANAAEEESRGRGL